LILFPKTDVNNVEITAFSSLSVYTVQLCITFNLLEVSSWFAQFLKALDNLCM